MSSAAIETDGLTKRFGPVTAVDQVSISVAPGEIFGLLGPNGAGKSTTLRCLLGLIRASAGSCSIFGADSWADRNRAHERIGVLPSDFAFEDEMTGRAVLALLARLRGAVVQERAEALSLRLRADLDRPLKELSRGNRQKIGLITALAHDPDLVIMDEPTSGFDPLMQEEFLRILGELRVAGRTVLLSSHNMAEVERACDRVALIHDGKLMEITDVQSLLARSPKTVHALFAEPVSPDEFSGIDGVSELSVDGVSVALKVTGNVGAVVAAASRHELVDFVCERPSLEDAFVELYRAGEQEA